MKILSGEEVNHNVYHLNEKYQNFLMQLGNRNTGNYKINHRQ